MYNGNRCLSYEEIGACLEGGLDNASRGLIEKHLHICNNCLDEVSSVVKVLTSSDDFLLKVVPEKLLKNAIALYPEKNSLFDAIVSLAKDAIKLIDRSSLMEISVPGPVFNMRGTNTADSNVILLRKSFDGFEADLLIEKISELLCNIKVIVRGDTDSKASANLRAGLFSGGRELASYHLDNGETVFEEIEPGLYTIRINRQGRILAEISLKIE